MGGASGGMCEWGVQVGDVSGGCEWGCKWGDV